MRLALLALMVTISTQAGAECGKFCDAGWWANATTADVHSEMAKGTNVTARTLDRSIQLHSAAAHGTAESIDILVAPALTYMSAMNVALHRCIRQPHKVRPKPSKLCWQPGQT